MENQDQEGVRYLTGEYPRVHNAGAQKLVEIAEMKTTVPEDEAKKTKHCCSRNHHDHDHDHPSGAGPGDAVVIYSQPAREKVNDRPPVDDCCPICFDDFVLPCTSNCGHWFCAKCILLVWHYKPALQLCNCPVCCRLITKLSPEASLLSRRDRDVVRVLKDIQQYNHFSVHGSNGLFLKIRALPLIRRMFRDLMHPRMIGLIVQILRGVGCLLGLICWVCNIGPDPIDWLIYFPQMADRWATGLILTFCLVYIYQRLMRWIQARRLAAVPLEHI